MNTCQIGIKTAVEKHVKDKSYLKFNEKDFIQILTSAKEKVNPSNFYGVATSVSNTLNKAINSDLNLGKIFYPKRLSNDVVGVFIDPTSAQLNLLNAKEEAEIQEALAILEKETPEVDRLSIENDLTFGVDEAGDSFIAYQIDEMPASKASPETVTQVKEVAKQMGIDIQTLSEYLKGNPELNATGVSGVADLIKGIVAVATGREEVAITEEIVHIATAILEQTNPQLITSLISKIDRFKIYKQVLNTYGKRKDYQLPNGKPDIRKIKKEAVDKLIAELIINQSEGSTEFPELMQEENRSMIQGWWNTIKDRIKGLYSKSNISLFEEAASTIIKGEVEGTTDIIKDGGVYLQIDNPLRDELYEKILLEDSKLKINLETPTDTRHYVYDGERVAKSVTEKLSEQDTFKDRTDTEKITDNQKKYFGIDGHALIENEIITNLIDKDGFAKPQTNIPIATNLDPLIATKIKEFARDLINSYPVGTRFLLEKKVINTKEKGMLASTVDFKAIIPIEKSDGTKDIKVDTLDWKFIGIDKTREEDVPWYKRKKWTKQMFEYIKIDRNYGVKTEQTGKSRMIPFILNYEYNVPGMPKSGLSIKSMEIGKLDSTQETNLYLLPVPIYTESTGFKEVDNLLSALRQQWEKLYKTQVDPEDKDAKNLQLNELDKAIRKLHIKLDFGPLYGVAKTFQDKADETFKALENIDYSSLSKEDVERKLRELLDFASGAQKFVNLDQVFLSYTPKEGMSEEDVVILSKLEQVSASTKRMLTKIESLQKKYVVQLALKEGLTTKELEDKNQGVLSPEVEMGGFAKTFLEASQLSSAIINLGTKLWLKAKSLTELSIGNKIDNFADLIKPVYNEASKAGKTVFDLIGKTYDGKLSLIKKIDSKFLEEIAEAKEDKNRAFFLANLDMVEYNKLSEELIKKKEAEINSVTFSTDEAQDDKEKSYRISAIKDALDLNRNTFNGFNDYKFGRLIQQTLIEEGHYSQEYENMSKSPSSLALWNFITNMNEEAQSLGFITNQGTSFLPLVEATILEKFAQTSSTGYQLKDTFFDLFNARIDEDQTYSSTDKETGEVRKQIPKYFTRTDKSVEQLSKDITKIIPLYIKALQEYKNAKNMESTLLTLHAVEQAKGSLRVDNEGNIIFKGDVPDVVHSNKNAEFFQTIIDDALYNLGEDLGSLGNINLNTFVSKISKDEEQKEQKVISVKKTIKNADTLVRALAVGLKPLIGLANWAGGQFQAYINAGGVYKMREFEKNNLMVSTGVGFTIAKKALLDLFAPLNEDIATEKIRQITKGLSYKKWLGTWSFSDVMMSTNSFPERKLQFANALSFLDNAMVVDGKIVNIRQYLKAQDRKTKYDLDFNKRKELENSFEKRVQDLKDSSSLEKIAVLDENKITIPGVSAEEIANYRLVIKEYARTLNGQMSSDNKAGYRRDTIFSSFMMFKTWIPKLVYSRVGDIKKNEQLGEWEYGRARVFLKTWANIGFTNIKGLRDVYIGNKEGLKIMDDLLQAKKEEHYRKTGQVLQITNEEFYDLMRTQITNQLKELKVLFSMMAILLAAKAAEPPEDATALEKNRYKYFYKLINKVTDEVSFYYNPTSADSITKGSIIPSLGLLVKGEQIIESILKEGTGYTLGDQKLIDKAYPLKYFLNVIPGAAQFQTEILPLINPELAKEMGIRVTGESRQR